MNLDGDRQQGNADAAFAVAFDDRAGLGRSHFEIRFAAQIPAKRRNTPMSGQLREAQQSSFDREFHDRRDAAKIHDRANLQFAAGGPAADVFERQHVVSDRHFALCAIGTQIDRWDIDARVARLQRHAIIQRRTSH